jgi:16S rRNA (adenine1518-N6/adenine1519-N6)-dimethyltransferase
MRPSHTEGASEHEGPVFSPKRVKFLLEELGASPRKSFGQNFLIDQNILKKEVEALEISPEDIVIEIGPGLGALTGFLLEKAGKVVAIEFDEMMVQHLKTAGERHTSFELIHDDALQIDFDNLMTRLMQELGPGGHLKIAGNLPYNISTQILIKLLQGNVKPERMLFAFQWEVAERLTAQPKTKDYGSLTLLTQFYTQAKKLFRIKKTCFYPQPEIDTGVILFSFRDAGLGIEKNDMANFLDFIRKSFSVRRKTLKNALTAAQASDAVRKNLSAVPSRDREGGDSTQNASSPGRLENIENRPLTNSGAFSYTGKAIDQALTFCLLNEKVRAEDLELKDFAKLFHFLKQPKG